MRTPLVAGNWKMNTTAASAVAHARRVAQAAREAAEPTAAVGGEARGEAGGEAGGEMVGVGVAPPFPYLLPVREALAGSHVLLGAQDVHPAPSGAFTGEVSIPMLADCGVSFVLVGHSERRHVLQERDDLVRAKAHAVLESPLTCVLCIGETLEQRRAGETDRVNESQLRSALSGLSPGRADGLIVAYEPVWAIGTGVTATPDDAQRAHAHIRKILADLLSPNTAREVRILYGGSVKASNAGDLFAREDIDGGLVGGASLDAGEFAGIIRAAGARRA